MHVVHAWQFHGQAALLGGEFALMGGGAIGAYHDDVGLAHRKALDELLDFVDLSAVSPAVHLVEGNPVHAIQYVIERIGADLLVMGSLGRAGLTGALMGNVAERVLDQVTSSVVVVKPPGFISPVGLPRP